jgi:DNA-binding transcriptional MerR regulator
VIVNDEEQAPPSLRIGEAADRVGVSCRTLRYYEELGLLAPSQHSAGGARRYTEGDIGRLVRIRELQELLGFDLGEIGEILHGEDQLADIRSQYHAAGTKGRRAMLERAVDINDRLRSLVRTKQERLAEMMAELEAKAQRYRSVAAEMEEQPGRSDPGAGRERPQAAPVSR